MIVSVLTWPLRMIVFGLWFLKELVVSSLTVTGDAVRGTSRATPRVVRLPLRGAPAWHAVLISVLITLTPGTLTLGIAPPDEDDDDTGLIVHSMYHEDTAAAIADLDDMFQRMRRALALGGGS